MKTVDIPLGKGKLATGIEITLPEANMVLALGKKGYLMCGYLNLEVCEKFKGCAAVIRGVTNVKELLEGKVAAVTQKAKRLGLEPGMTGLQALKKLF